jgi:HK97 family phage major capsid protein
MDLKAMRQRMSALLKELGELHGTENRSADQEARIDVVLEEMNDLGPKIERAAAIEKRLADGRAQEREPAGTVAAREHAREGAEERADLDFRSPMDRFLESEAFTDYRKSPSGKSQRVNIESFHGRHLRSKKPMQFSDEPLSARDVRALLFSGSATAGMLQPEVYPTIYRGREPRLMMRDVLLPGETSTNAITILQESGFTNAAVEVPEATATSGGGYTAAAKPESAITFAQVTYDVATIAHWIPITRSALDDLPFLRTYVEARLETGLKRRENGQILNGDGLGANLTGLYETSGIQTLDDAYFTLNATENAGTAVENFERILRAKTLVSTVAEAEATFVVLNPSDHEKLQTLADANDRYYGSGPFAAGNIPTLWGLPIVIDQANTAGHALVGDGTMAAVVDRMDAQIFVSDSHADFFTHNMFAFLAEERLALPVFRPVAFADVELV